MGRTACTEPQCLYKGDLYLYVKRDVGNVLFVTLKIRLTSGGRIIK